MSRVALDLEEVLADTIHEACQSTENLTVEDFHDWDLDDYTWQVYSGVSDALWRHDPLSIQPVEPGLSEYTAEIHEKADRLDIVTARLHVDEQIATWLDHHEISYDSIVSARTPKHELDGYDVFIDDNPEMFGNCRLLLRHHPHNANLPDGELKSCDRINSLSEAVSFL